MIDLKNVSRDTHIDCDNFCSAQKVIDLSCSRGDKAKFNSIVECVYSLKPPVFRNLWLRDPESGVCNAIFFIILVTSVPTTASEPSPPNPDRSARIEFRQAI